jgi:hypothetical protein
MRGSRAVDDLESCADVTPEVVSLLLDALAIALAQRGLVAESFTTRMVRAWMVWAKNGAADPPGGDPRAMMSPGLRQTVVCQPDDEGRLSWFWVWSGPTSEAPPELEYLGPAEYIAATADRIAHVLRLDGVDLVAAT